MMRKTFCFTFKNKRICTVVFSFLGLLFFCSDLQAQSPLLRFPDVYKNKVAFVAGEDIWIAEISNGQSTRLTMHEGQERYPKFSPDGNLIAFTGEFDGNNDVYVMNSDGSNIQRVTYHPGTDEIIGWHPTKNKIMFASGRNSTSRYTKLFLISPDGTGLEELIMYDAARGSFSPDGSKIAYNKTSRENRTWKRYKGGRAQEIYIYDFNSNEETNISNFKGTDRLPMWIDNKIYFTSDRDRSLNIYSYDNNSKEIEKITNHNDYDARRAECGIDQIVYESGGKIWILNTKTKENRQLDVKINTDFPDTRAYIKNVKGNITGFDVSPMGKRALIVARGEVFSVPKEYGPTRNLSQNCGARDKDAVWSPDGRRIAYLSDKTGEYELYIVKPDGKSESIKLTTHTEGYRHTLRWSPDSKKIAFADNNLKCYFVDVSTKRIAEVDKAEYENIDISLNNKPIYDFNWSPDSKYIAYSKMNENLVYQIYIYSLSTKKAESVSDGLYNDFNPVFSQDGEHLLFISNRRFSPTLCDIEWEMVYKDVAGIYALTLTKNGKSISPFKSDEENGIPIHIIASASKVDIDFEGISHRIEALHIPKGNYRDLYVSKTNLFYLNKDYGDFNKMDFREIGSKTLYSYSFETQKENIVIKNINSYKLSVEGNHVIYAKNGSIGIISANSQKSKGYEIDLIGLKMEIDPILEWKEIFNEAWRFERDYYYEKGMHGIDWNEMKIKYGKLIENATCRQDIRFIIGELIGELNTSHTYIYGGDFRRKAIRVNIGMLGVDWEVDNSSKRYKFKKIYKENDWSRQVYPPLGKSGVNINEGDYLISVNGVKATADKNIYSYFIDIADKQVVLTVNNKPSVSGAREVTVKPIRSELVLRYINWLELNRTAVDKASNGQIGYIYLPDTYTGSATDFPRYFYSQTKKKGLIIDGRFNGGGLDPEIFFQRLIKKPHGYWTRRYSANQPLPLFAVTAHMACLTNKYAGSGGDQLAYEFRRRKMGPVIGTRTWGGLVGFSMFIDLIDGGELTVPDYRIYNEKGDWIVENEGVEPDIILEQNSLELSQGKDTQLLKAVEVLMKKIDKEPYTFPAHKPFPVDK